MRELLIVGAGGHARSVIEAARSQATFELVACTDPRPELVGTELDGVPIVGDDTLLDELRKRGIDAAVLGLGSVGDSAPRARLHALLQDHGFELPVIVACSATVAGNTTIGPGTVVLQRVVVGPGAVVGANAILNTASVIEHDCVVGDHAHVASGALLGGAVTIGDGAHIGIGAVVREGVHVGQSALVGAGAVVVGDVPEGVVVTGFPARART